MENNIIVLCSSNYEKEYILDILEAIGRPRGFVMHFRYRKKWVDDDLWNKLPQKTQNRPRKFYSRIILWFKLLLNRSPLVGNPVLVTYIYQKSVRGSKTKWEYAYPIRFGKIKEYYKTGDSLDDVAYFYFEIQDYCSVETLGVFNNNIMNLMNTSGSSATQIFAAQRKLSTVNASIAQDDSAFQSTAGSIDLAHFKSPDGKTQYSPVFLFIRGIKEVSLIRYDFSLRRRYYELIESNSYNLEASIFLRESPYGDSTVNLEWDSRQFIIPHSAKEPIYSRYDEFVWRIVPTKVLKDTAAIISINTNVQPPPKTSGSNVLNLTLPLHLKLKFNRGRRLVETVQDIGLAFTTILIAWVGLLQKIEPTNSLVNKLLILAAVFFFVAIVIKAYMQLRG